MKVGTDGVLLGTWANISSTNYTLDIGTGTGLIALILAQRTKSKIDAIEIDIDSCKEAKVNVLNSKWRNRINIYHTSFQEYYKSASKKYDIIITNPPYFTNSLKSANKKRNVARHNDLLSFNDLLTGVAKLLKPCGKFYLILAFKDAKTFITGALKYKLYCSKETFVKTTPCKKPKRVLLEFSFSEAATIRNEIIIEQTGRHQYSKEYKNLTKDFYLNM